MKLDKKMFIAPYNLGILEETEGNIGAAISAYQESIKLKSGFPPSRFRLGRLYERNGSTDQAVEQYAKALRIDQAMRDPRRNPLVVDSRLLEPGFPDQLRPGPGGGGDVDRGPLGR